MALPHQVQPDAAHARPVHGVQRTGGDVRRHHRNAAQRLGLRLQLRQQLAVVGAQEAGLHQHTAQHAHRLRSGPPIGPIGAVAGTVARTWHGRPGLEQVEVAVDRGQGLA